MNLAQAIELYGGGPGSGCNPDVGKCGRPKVSAKPVSSGSVFNTYDMDSAAGHWVLDEMALWKFNTGTKAGRLGLEMKDYIASAMEDPDPKEHLFIQKAGGVLQAVGTYLWWPDSDKSFIVASLVMNPKYLGSGAIKDVIRNIKNHAKELGATKVQYSRLGKGKAGSESPFRVKDVQGSVLIYVRAALEEA